MYRLVFGSVLGAAFAVALSRVLRTPTSFDPAVWTGVPPLLGVTTLLATALPALRATRVVPAEALPQD